MKESYLNDNLQGSCGLVGVEESAPSDNNNNDNNNDKSAVVIRDVEKINDEFSDSDGYKISNLATGFLLSGINNSTSDRINRLLDLKQEDIDIVEKISFDNNTVLVEHINYLLTCITKCIYIFDQSTGKHSINVAKILISEFEFLLENLKNTNGIDKDLNGLDPNIKKYMITVGGLLHDIGKIGVQTSILNKSSKLDEIEEESIHIHALLSSFVLGIKNFDFSGVNLIIYNYIELIARQHHEKIDGKGYPYKLTGDEISFISKFVSAVDIFESVSSNRIYDKKLNTLDGLKKALKLLIVLHRPGLKDEIISHFVAKFGVENIDIITYDNISDIVDELKINGSDEVKRNINETLDRINKSKITSEKTAVESFQYEELENLKVIKKNYKVKETLLNELSIRDETFDVMKNLGFDGKLFVKLEKYKDSFGVLLGEIIEDLIKEKSFEINGNNPEQKEIKRLKLALKKQKETNKNLRKTNKDLRKTNKEQATIIEEYQKN